MSASFTNEQVLLREGFRVIPKQIDFTAYAFAFKNVGDIVQSYITTTVQAFGGGTFISVLVMSLCAYAISRRDFALAGPISFLIFFFTMLFNGGLVPTYLLNYKYLKLGNTMWVYILPTMCNAFYIIILRTFFFKDYLYH